MVRDQQWRRTAGDWGCLIVTLVGIAACLAGVIWLWGSPAAP